MSILVAFLAAAAGSAALGAQAVERVTVSERSGAFGPQHSWREQYTISRDTVWFSREGYSQVANVGVWALDVPDQLISWLFRQLERVDAGSVHVVRRGPPPPGSGHRSYRIDFAAASPLTISLDGGTVYENDDLAVDPITRFLARLDIPPLVAKRRTNVLTDRWPHPRPAWRAEPEDESNPVRVCETDFTPDGGWTAVDWHRWLDVDGRGAVDLICKFRIGDTWGTSIHVRDDAHYRRTLRLATGELAAAWRDAPGSPVHVMLHWPPCCAGFQWEERFYAPRWVGDSLAWEKHELRVGSTLLYYAADGLTAPIPFEVLNDGYKLRWSPLIDSTCVEENKFSKFSEHWPPPPIADWERENLVALYPAGARGVALAEAADPTGRVWWFVVMDTAPPPTWTHYLTWDARMYVEAKHYGWMSSRYLRPLALPTRAATERAPLPPSPPTCERTNYWNNYPWLDP